MDRPSARRLVGFGAQQVGENVALVGAELALIARRVEHRRALIEGHGAQILKGALDHGLAIGRERHETAPGLPNLHLFLRRHMLQHLAACQAAFALVLGQLVQLVQLLHQALLGRRGQAVETGIVAQQTFLILNGKALMPVEPVS